MMEVRWPQRRVVLVALLATLVLGIATVGAQAQGADDLAALHQQFGKLYEAGKYVEAIEIAKRSLPSLRRRWAPPPRRRPVAQQPGRALLRAAAGFEPRFWQLSTGIIARA